MRIIHVLRKPPSEGTVASNTLKHGAGGLNIDASRITTEDNHNGGAYAENPTHRAGEYQQPKGRWPANVILQHLEGCRRDGVKKVKGNRTDTRPDGDGGRADKSQWRFRPTDQTKRGFSEDDGMETVADWICEPGCPVARLDEQSGVLKSGAPPSTQYTEGDRDNSSMFAGDGVFTHQGYKADTGGASRFYKQVGGK